MTNHYRFLLTLVKGGSGQNLARLPAEYRVRGYRIVAVVLFVFSFLFGFTPVLEVLRAHVHNHIDLITLQDWIFGSVGMFLFITALNQFLIKGKLTIENGRARCVYRSLFGGDNWSEPLESYEGVCSKYEVRGSGSFDQIIYTIWLMHKKKKKRIQLYSSWSNDGVAEQLAKYAEMLNVPVLDKG